MDLTEASANFTRATRHCDNLIEIHRAHGGPNKGKRDKETTLNRAVVVLTVAAWQAAVQDLALACVELADPGAGSPEYGMFKLLSGRVRKEIGDLNTPNSQNSRNLLLAAGFDPRPHWTWTRPGGQGRPYVTLKPHDIEDNIEGWLKIRHAIAHGHAELPARSVLQVVRAEPNKPPSNPTLRLVDAEQCLSFFRQLTRTTGRALAAEMRVGVPSGWT